MGSGDVWFFDRVAPLYDRVMPPVDRAALAAALAMADREVTRVVDVGGGSGRAIRTVDATARVVVDASPGMLRRVPNGIGRVLGSATALPIRDGAVDAVLCVDALHHLPEPETVLSEARRVVRPGGVVVIREFDRTTLRGRLVGLGERVLGFDSRFFSADELADALAAVGLSPTVLERGFDCTVVGRKPGT